MSKQHASYTLSVQDAACSTACTTRFCVHRAVTAVAHGLHRLASAGEGLQQRLAALTDTSTRLSTQLTSVLSFAKRHERSTELQQQRQAVARAARLGLSVLVVTTGWAALRFGRIWELHQACGASVYGRGGKGSRWSMSGVLGGARMLAGANEAFGWARYAVCAMRQLGELQRWLNAK